MVKKEKELDTALRFIVKTSVIVFITLILSKIFSYLYKIVIARNFGVEVYGLFSLALVIIGFLTTLSAWGLLEGLMRYVPFYRGKKEFEKIRYLINASFKVILVTSVVISALLFFFADIISLNIFHTSELSYYLRTLTIVIPLTLISSIYLNVIKSFEKIGTYALLNNFLQNGLKFLLLIILLSFGLGLNALLFSYILSFAGLAIISYYFSNKLLTNLVFGKSLKDIGKKKLFSSVLNYSWPLIFVGLIYSILYSIDTLFLGYFKSASDVGWYNAALTIVMLFYIIPELFIALFAPLMTRKFSEGKHKLIRDITKQVFKWIYLVNLPLLAIILIFPGVIINTFFGAGFLAAENPLRILAIGVFFSVFISFLISLLSAKGKSKLILKNFVGFTLMNIILDLILVPKYGMNGAAIATTIVWVLFYIVMIIQTKKIFGFYPYRWTLIKITLVTLLPICLLLYLDRLVIPSLFNLIWIGLLFGLSYILLIILTKCLDEKDIMIVNAIKTKINGFVPIRKTN